MGSTPVPKFSDQLVQLVLRAGGANTLIQSEDDWRELGVIASRMLFWRGGAIYACRCDRDEIRFAIQVGHASLGSIAHHISGAYAIHLRHKHGASGAIFRHYAAISCDEDYLVELVFWLHRSKREQHEGIWTTENAYLAPGSIPWVSVERVFRRLGTGSPVPATYWRRKSEPFSPEAIKLFTRGLSRARRLELGPTTSPEVQDARHATLPDRPGIIDIARIAAELCQVTYEDMFTPSRKRAVSKARAITTVLATRNGATVAAAARLFERSRSTLIEQVEYYRANQPGIFTKAESILESFALGEARK